MSDVWLGIKAWTKGIVFGAILLYAVIFVAMNTSKPVDFWWWFHHEQKTSVFVLTTAAFFGGMIFAVVVSTTYRTVRQFQELRTRSRLDRLERGHLEVAAKAAKLQSRPAGGDVVSVDELAGR